jgi:Holin of 3TMs, for gene-transfer release
MASTPPPLDVEDLSTDPFTSRARPAFLYVMYGLLLGAFPIAAIAAVSRRPPRPAPAPSPPISMPSPSHSTLFGTGYLGYTVVREWGKAKAPR